MQQIAAIALIVLGAIAIAVGLFADSLGVGGAPNAVGWKQIALAAGGAVVAVGGVAWMLRLRVKSR